ncbi:MAG: ATPase, T2SS/T4P/T4SS family [Planctomycetota bacterium]
MTSKTELSLGETLVKMGVLSQPALEQALKEHLKSQEPLIHCLARLKLAEEKKMLEGISQHYRWPLVNLKDIKIAPELVKKIAVKFIAHYKFMPVNLENNVLTIAVSTPPDIRMLDEIRLNLGHELKVVLAGREDIINAIKKHYGLAADTIEKIMIQSGKTMVNLEEEMLVQIEDIEKADDASVIKLVNQILLEGYRRRATDIHFEPYRGKIKLRYRVDGLLYDANVPPAIKNFFPAILSRIKIMSNLNIVERRLPQDGRALVKTEQGNLDLRISVIPTPYGESVVIRLLPTQMLYRLEDLGIDPNNLKILKVLLGKPHGIIFMTGPTGSGKTTTLYACLSCLNTEKVKIIAIEDPIEYELEGITQIQVNPEIQLTFARGLRSMLRHDPDIMMVGEVRDQETAEITTRVALTGHLVFSTLHTNDAASGVIRLTDIGIEPYLITSSVEAFIAQRLVRLICSGCRTEDTANLPEIRKEIAAVLGLDSPQDVKVYKGTGCEACSFTGYQGRTAIYEILLMDDKIKKLVLRKASADEIKKAAMESGMKTLRQVGWEKVINGLTTPEEVMWVTPSEKYTPAPTTSAASSSVAAASPFTEPVPESEQRVYRRLRTRVPLEYSLYKKSMDDREEQFLREFRTIATDISATGVLFETNQFVPVSAIVKLKIELPFVPKKIECLVRIIRVEEIKKSGRYNVGSQFLDIDSADKTLIDKLVQQEHGIITKDILWP